MLRLAHRILSQDLRPIRDRCPKQNRTDVAGYATSVAPFQSGFDRANQSLSPTMLPTTRTSCTASPQHEVRWSYSELSTQVRQPFDPNSSWSGTARAIRFPDGKPFRPNLA